MDIFAHTLWAAAASRETNEIAEKKNKRFHINVGWGAFFGVFPDLLAFGPPFLVRFYFLLIGSVSFANVWGKRAFEEGSFRAGFGLAQNLYQWSHSLVIWALVFAIVWAFYKRPRYELLGWALHILIDIPSHTLVFFPTPFLFPLSSYVFTQGVQWSNRWFMIVNYGLLLTIWGRYFIKDLMVKMKTNRL